MCQTGIAQNYGMSIFVQNSTMNIVITGSSRGIGFETARSLLAAGHNVFAISRNSGGLAHLKESTAAGDRIKTFPFDLVSGDIPGVLLPAVNEFMEEVDILINNAGLLVNRRAELLGPEDFDRIFQANVRAPFSLIQALLPLFKKGSHIVNIGSMGGFQGSAKFSGLSLYSASKGALAILSECLAEEFKERGIRVNCLAIGSAQTEMLAAAFPGYSAPVSAAEMASFVADFALRGHHWFNGKVIPVALTTP
jgi:NAD(P)-dependent dehydrogenase (short-subunit alcohol dehydrogenase family)